ncbi:hypothetical protein D3C87_2004710 [compost metagenome]
MKTKVPDIGAIINFSTMSDTRKKSIHQNKLVCHLRIFRGEHVSNHQTNIVTNDISIRDAIVIQ